MSGLSTHVLDLTTGRPASGVSVEVWREGAPVRTARTDADGRCAALHGEGPLLPGQYQLVFAIGAYFAGAGDAFFEKAHVAFTVAPGMTHCHVPLLATPFSYSTYRGS